MLLLRHKKSGRDFLGPFFYKKTEYFRNAGFPEEAEYTGSSGERKGAGSSRGISGFGLSSGACSGVTSGFGSVVSKFAELPMMLFLSI
jgi:hypothetical protein